MKARLRVVRYHRRLRPIALPQQESAQTSMLSVCAQPDRTTAVREVPEAWLPLISSASEVTHLGRNARHQSEPGSRDLPGQLSCEILRRHSRLLLREARATGALSPPGRRACATVIVSGVCSETEGSWYVSLIAKALIFEFNES